jgi:SAM-dependent MidA family methyltransferase
VRADADGSLAALDGPLSSDRLERYLSASSAALEPGWRAEINLKAVDWIGDVARRLRRGFVILIDYGHEARDLYSASHAGGTLTSFAAHQMAGPESHRDSGDQSATPVWLMRPGEQDLTAHVDFTSLRMAAEQAGLTTIGFLDQTYFVLGVLQDAVESGSPGIDAARHSRALRTLMMPGGLGSTHKVLILGKNIGTPRLRGCSFGQRVT